MCLSLCSGQVAGLEKAKHFPPGRAEQRTGADRAKGSLWLQYVTRGAAAHRGRSARVSSERQGGMLQLQAPWASAQESVPLLYAVDRMVATLAILQAPPPSRRRHHLGGRLSATCSSTRQVRRLSMDKKVAIVTGGSAAASAERRRSRSSEGGRREAGSPDGVKTHSNKPLPRGRE